MKILLPGLYPRSEELIKATKNFERKIIRSEQLQYYFQEDLKHILTLQQGFPYLTTGLFNWQDYLRPIKHLSMSIEAKALKRFHETNTFWRILTFKRSFLLENIDENWIKEYFHPTEEPLIINLPFLFLFKMYSEGISLHRITTLLMTLISYIVRPQDLLCFYEPVLGWRELAKEEKKIAAHFVEQLKRNYLFPLFLWTSFHLTEVNREFLYALPVDGIGIDFYQNDFLETLQNFPSHKHLMAGIIPVDSTLIASTDSLEKTTKLLKNHHPKDQIWLTPNGPSELLPQSVMDTKLIKLRDFLNG